MQGAFTVPTFTPNPLLSMVAQMVKNLSAMQETQVRSLGGEDPIEKGMATHSSILVPRIPKTEEPGLDMTEQLTLSLHFPYFCSRLFKSGI